MPKKSKMNKKKNKFIYWWKKYFKKWQTGLKKKGYQDWQIEKLTKDIAIHQLEEIENAPNKKEKPTEKQQEYLDWLETVAKTGVLEKE